MHTVMFNKFQQIKYFLKLVCQASIILILGIDATMLKRIITDLTFRGLSLNHLQQHLFLIYDYRLSHESIQAIQQEAAVKAKELNHRFDKTVAPKINITEADEVFQGQKTIILGSVDKWSNYCLGLQKCLDRTKQSIEGFLQPIAKRCINIKVVITDLFAGYKDSIPRLYRKAVQLVCHLHAGRILRRSVRHLGAILSRRKKEFSQLKTTQIKKTNQFGKLSTRIAFLSTRLQADQKLSKTLVKQKTTKRTKYTQTLDKKLSILGSRIKKDTVELKKLRSEKEKVRCTQRKQLIQEKKLKKTIATATQDLLQSSRLVHDFVRLLRDFSPKFGVHKERFLNRLEKSSYSIAKEIQKMIKDNSALFSIRKASILPWNFQNTNTIEGIFSQFRRLLHATRLLSSDGGCEWYCELFRLYHNTMPPFTGPHQYESPVERLGIKLNGKHYLDLIFPMRGRITHFFVENSPTHFRKKLHFQADKPTQCQILIP